jgi:hypothetical protein
MNEQVASGEIQYHPQIRQLVPFSPHQIINWKFLATVVHQLPRLCALLIPAYAVECGPTSLLKIGPQPCVGYAWHILALVMSSALGLQ